MLKFIRSIDQCIEKFESDYYIPFSVRFSEGLKARVSMWMIVNNDSVLEVAVDNQTGVLEYITLANIAKKDILSTNDVFSITGVIVDGVPICDLKFFGGRILVRSELNIRLIIGGDFFKILVSNDAAEKCYRTGRIYIGVNEQNELCEIIMSKMVRQEMDVLKNCLGV